MRAAAGDCFASNGFHVLFCACGLEMNYRVSVLHPVTQDRLDIIAWEQPTASDTQTTGSKRLAIPQTRRHLCHQKFWPGWARSVIDAVKLSLRLVSSPCEIGFAPPPHTETRFSLRVTIPILIAQAAKPHVRK